MKLNPKVNFFFVFRTETVIFKVQKPRAIVKILRLSVCLDGSIQFLTNRFIKIEVVLKIPPVYGSVYRNLIPTFIKTRSWSLQAKR